MKKILMAALTASALSATPAMAQTVQTYAVTGTVNALCSISGATTAINFGTLTNTTGGFALQNASPSVTDSGAYCNQASTTVSIAHTNLTTTATSAGFTNTVVITPAISTPQHPTQIVGDVGPVALGAFTGLTVYATAANPGVPLVAGVYNGTITVTLAPSS